MTDFTLVVFTDSLTSCVAVTLDMLSAAQVMAPRCRVAAPTWRVLSPQGGVVRLSGGLELSTRKLPQRARPDASVWVLPGIRLEDPAQLRDRLADPRLHQAARAVARHVAAGGRVAASCFAVFVLALAGVADGRRVTTTWWLARALQQHFPACLVDADRMVCADGPITTAGAALAQTDLMLHLLRTHGGYALADWVSRVLLIDARAAQSPYVVPQALAAGDGFVSQLVEQIEARLPNQVSVAQLAQRVAMSPRTLSRRVQHATGKTPMALIQSVRLRKARELLQSTGMGMEQVAAAVGYQDATALRRMVKKTTGVLPSQLRTHGAPHPAAPGAAQRFSPTTLRPESRQAGKPVRNQ
ncbi:GlxA family transcriptional regulator [Ottowia testudinis]|uniref:Helix-turn-helix domain-containing protein n=1 Tax=Ottowia testudinis TaxID=2816950 RepID=A0A975CG86_9BURK|nr:helix-turn-helix domain-containing protein [Ottowia testudinis]QTD44531.1 helix-turn-helix domain-containing protein [Ottowia testudinis]